MNIHQLEHDQYMILHRTVDETEYSFIIMKEFYNGVQASSNIHFHSTYEVHIPVLGDLHILLEDNDIYLQPGSVCIIPPNVLHYIYQSENSYKVGFRFTYQYANHIATDSPAFDSNVFDALTNARIITACPIYDKYIITALKNIKLNYPHYMIADLLYLAIHEIALHIAPNAAPYSSLPPVHYGLQISEIIENYINQHYMEKITTKDLANELHFSKRHTERLVQKYFATSFLELVNKKRLATAKFLLKVTDTPISIVAEICGFDDRNYFQEKFKTIFQITPLQYRKQVTNSEKKQI